MPTTETCSLAPPTSFVLLASRKGLVPKSAVNLVMSAKCSEAKLRSARTGTGGDARPRTSTAYGFRAIVACAT